MARKARHTPSSIQTLPPELFETLGELRIRRGWSVDQLHEWLKEQGHERSRSAVGRHVRRLHLDVDRAGEKIARATAISKALMERFGDQPDNELARLNIQLLHGQVFDLIIGEAESMGDDDEAGDGENEGDKPRDPLTLVRLSKTIQQLLSAEKMNAERIAQIRKLAREEAQLEAVAAVEAVAKRTERGFSKETVEAIKREILKVG